MILGKSSISNRLYYNNMLIIIYTLSRIVSSLIKVGFRLKIVCMLISQVVTKKYIIYQHLCTYFYSNYLEKIFKGWRLLQRFFDFISFIKHTY